MSDRATAAYSKNADFGTYDGDDLTSQDLDDLYDYSVGKIGAEDKPAVLWLKDKQHQVVRRLVARLTRAEYYLPCAESEINVLADAALEED